MATVAVREADVQLSNNQKDFIVKVQHHGSASSLSEQGKCQKVVACRLYMKKSVLMGGGL